MSVCVSVCLSENFRAAYRAQKWLDLAEICYTCFLGEYLELFFFSYFENFHFWAPGPKLARKPTGQPREPKNGWIWLKFATLVPWVNIWGYFFIF